MVWKSDVNRYQCVLVVASFDVTVTSHVVSEGSLPMSFVRHIAQATTDRISKVRIRFNTVCSADTT